MLARMRLRAIACRALLVAAGVLGAATPAWSVPVGYRYIGSRVVSEGRVVYWYWNVDHVEIGPFGVSFVARMYARAVDINQERPFVAVVRCDTRKYRGIDSPGPYESIEDGDPIGAVWSAGMRQGRRPFRGPAQCAPERCGRAAGRDGRRDAFGAVGGRGLPAYGARAGGRAGTASPPTRGAPMRACAFRRRGARRPAMRSLPIPAGTRSR